MDLFNVSSSPDKKEETTKEEEEEDGPLMAHLNYHNGHTKVSSQVTYSSICYKYTDSGLDRNFSCVIEAVMTEVRV